MSNQAWDDNGISGRQASRLLGRIHPQITQILRTPNSFRKIGAAAYPPRSHRGVFLIQSFVVLLVVAAVSAAKKRDGSQAARLPLQFRDPHFLLVPSAVSDRRYSSAIRN